MRPRPLLLLSFLAAGCALPPGPGADPVATPPAEPPRALLERALVDLGSGDPARDAAARGRLVAAGPEADAALAGIVRSSPAGSPARLDALAVLAERGDPLEGVPVGEVVAMTLREIDRGEPAGRPLLLGIERLRARGEPARRSLLAEAAAEGPHARTARRLLDVLPLPPDPGAATRP